MNSKIELFGNDRIKKPRRLTKSEFSKAMQLRATDLSKGLPTKISSAEIEKGGLDYYNIAVLELERKISPMRIKFERGQYFEWWDINELEYYV